jgi:hypothetical protein
MPKTKKIKGWAIIEGEEIIYIEIKKSEALKYCKTENEIMHQKVATIIPVEIKILK